VFTFGFQAFGVIMATIEQLDSSIDVIMDLNDELKELNQTQQIDSSLEKLEVEESPEESVCRMCANHAKGVDMLLKENSEVRLVVKQYLHLEVHILIIL
jgi:hypothetical protein